MAWVKEQNAKSRPAIEKDAGFHPLLDRFTEIATSRERIPAISKLGAFVYNFWQDAANPRGLWRRTTLAEYRKAQPAWETVLDLDKLSAAENEQWAWKGADVPVPEVRALPAVASRAAAATRWRCASSTSRRRRSSTGGFRLPESKGGVGLDRRGHDLRCRATSAPAR